MNVSSQPLFASASQYIKFPPFPRSSSLPTSSTWTSPSTSTHPDIATQQIDDTTHQTTTNKPQNKRGRKPLNSMPTTKKHIQNLNNQRAFRQRREIYVRTLESKTSRFEKLLEDAHNEVESLKEKVDVLEKRVLVEESIRASNINIVHNNNINSFNDDNSSLNEVQYNSNSEDQQSSQANRCFTPFTTTNTSSFLLNDQHRLNNQLPELHSLQLISASRDQKQLWTTIPSHSYSSNVSHMELPHQQDYFSPTVPSVVTTTTNSLTHPLHLKWILSDSDNKYL